MKSQKVTKPTLAHPRLDRARLQPSRRQDLAAPVVGAAANQHTSSDPLDFARPFAPSSPRPDTRLREQRIGGFTLPSAPESHPLSAPDHCDRLPLPGELDRPPAALWLANGRHVRAGNGQRTNAFLPESGQTCVFPCLFGTSFSHSRPRPRSPRIRRWAFPWRSHRTEIRFALAGSTRTAYQGETPVSTVAFIMGEAFQHPAHLDLSDQARISDVIQDSDFRTKSPRGKNRIFLHPSVRQAHDGRLRNSTPVSPRQPNT
jgi:hypothetical protein